MYWQGRKADRGKVVENDWSAVKIRWDNGLTNFDLPQRHDQRGIDTREVVSMGVGGLTSSLSPRDRTRSSMAIPTIEKREEYIGYAEHCVKLQDKQVIRNPGHSARDGRGMAKTGRQGRQLATALPDRQTGIRAKHLCLLQGLRDKTHSEQRLPKFVQELYLPFGTLFHIARKGADQSAANSCQFLPSGIWSDNSMPCSAALESSPFVMQMRISARECPLHRKSDQ